MEERLPHFCAKSHALMGATVGGVCGMGSVALLGDASLFSLAGITKGLSILGGFVGGSALSGLAIVAAPVFVGGFFADRLMRKKVNARQKSVLYQSIGRLYRLQDQLTTSGVNFGKERHVVAALIEELEGTLMGCSR
ncbi:MAG: hypothetical protein HQL87_10870 [Magnetococcales bacterium]|nr:hypothetical protein [Magnetococcales bacterium]